jgi:hypothetical protein
MKLANTTHFIARRNALSRAGRNYLRPTRYTTTRTFNIRRPLVRLVARWRVCPKTHRLECLWSSEPMVYDDQLCRSRSQNRRAAWPNVRPGSSSALGQQRTQTIHRYPCCHHANDTLRYTHSDRRVVASFQMNCDNKSDIPAHRRNDLYAMQRRK